MLYIIALLLTLDAGPIWSIDDMEIYTQLNRGNTAVAPDGRIFVLDKAECRIHYYNAEGQLVKSFGKKGQGPGEMSYPFYIWAREEGLYVKNMMQQVLQWDLDGNFIKSHTFKSNTVVPVKGGWVTTNFSNFGGKKDPGQVTWYDVNFENEEVILDFRGPDFVPQENSNIRLDMNTKLPLNPAPDSPRMATNDDGTLLFYTHPGNRFKISVIDTQTRKVINVIEKDWKAPAFNKEWGEAQIEKRNEPQEGRQFQIKFKGDFPDVFPQVRHFKVVNDILYITRWNAVPGGVAPVKALDTKGNEVTPEYDAKTLARILDARPDSILISTFDGDEEIAGLAMVKAAEAAAFVKANPLAESASQAGGLVIMN